jgi:phage terminase small subunit
VGVALTAKQARFVAEYLVDLNATQAATRAGYSAKTAEQQGPRLLGNVGVRRAIDEALARRSERIELKSDDVLRELLRLARVDIGEAFDHEGHLKPLHLMSEDCRRAIAGVEVEAVAGEAATVTKVKFWDKTRALELLGKHLKLFTDKVELSGRVTLEQLLEKAGA